MSDVYHHGVSVVEISEGARALRTVSTAVVGLVAIAPDADGEVFPSDEPILITDIRGALASAGEEGTLSTALRAIADQASPIVVVVRVEVPDEAEDLDAAVIGGYAGGYYSGLQALLSAQARLGVKPRILGAPGLDTPAVTAALATVAQKLNAFAYASASSQATIADALTYRQTFGARELMLLWPEFTVGGAADSAVARALGLRAKLDQTVGWHKTISNVAVNGVTGLSKDVYWDLQNPDCEAVILNAGDVTALINNGSGYCFWGSRTCAEDPLFAFESATRTAQVLRDTIGEGLLWAIDKPLRPSLARDILETINAKFRSLKSQGYIIGAEATLDPSKNPSLTLAAGELYIDYEYTPCPPLERLGLEQRITDKYFVDFAQLAAQTAS